MILFAAILINVVALGLGFLFGYAWGSSQPTDTDRWYREYPGLGQDGER